VGLLDLFRRKATAGGSAVRAFQPATRYYTAGAPDRLTSSWTTTVVSVHDVTQKNLRVLRARSREQYRNNDYASRFVQLVKSNVVGPNGITIQATVENSPAFTAQYGPLDTAANDAIEAAFQKWGRASTCDTAGRLSWVQMQQMALASVAVDGEFIAIVNRKAGNQFGFSLLAMDPDLLDVELNVDPRQGRNRIRFGVEVDAVGRAVNYWFKGDNGHTAVPADDVLHLFISEYVGQLRGFPMLATALPRLQMLAGYEEAAITAARVGAAKMGFFTSAAGDGYTGSDTDSDGAVITDVSPGTFEQLPAGTSFTSFNPDYPHQQFGEFTKACLRGISAGLGVSYAGLSNDLEGVNYSSIRAGVLEDREAWKSLQTWFIDGFVRPVYETWIDTAIGLQNAVALPNGGSLRAQDIDRYKSASFQPRRWSWVDPLKDTDANVTAINNGLKSRGEVIREQGRDPDDVWRELAAEQARLDQLGISIQQQQPTNGGSNDPQQV
jgi:lambda family phage portal protein